MTSSKPTGRTFEVHYGNEWAKGVPGWMCNGIMGATKEEAVLESLILLEGVEYDRATDILYAANIVDVTDSVR